MLLLHVHVPELQQMWGEVQVAAQQVVVAAAAALDRVAQTFLESYGVFRSLAAAVADLDVLAGFAQVCHLLCLGSVGRPQMVGVGYACGYSFSAQDVCLDHQRWIPLCRQAGWGFF
jgi:DNA mismatch repair ATPase MutS